MKCFSFIALASLISLPSRGADATTPVDYTQRNGSFMPAGATPPERKTLPMAEAVQEKRVDKTTVDKKPAAVGDKRAPLELAETRAKNVQEKSSTRPTADTITRSAFDHREAAITTASDTTKPPMVAKYQDSMAAAQTVKIERASATSGATAAKVNRFVFRKNGAEGASPVGGAPVTPAAGGSAVLK